MYFLRTIIHFDVVKNTLKSILFFHIPLPSIVICLVGCLESGQVRSGHEVEKSSSHQSSGDIGEDKWKKLRLANINVSIIRNLLKYNQNIRFVIKTCN